MTSPTPLLDRWSSVSQWKDMSSLYREIGPDLDRVEDRLASWSRSANPLTAEISRYVLRKKGKRLRPALVLLTSRLFSPGSEESVFLASLVEILHTASLIHDDIVDNAGLRRGRKSVHAKWGPNITVLLGDYLYIKSIGLSLQSRHERITRLLTDVSARMIEGELDEYALGGDLQITEDQVPGDRREQDGGPVRRLLPHRGHPRTGLARGGGGRRGLRPGPGQDVPDRRRPPRLHRGRAGARQARPVRPRRGADHPAAHPRAEEGRPLRAGPPQGAGRPEGHLRGRTPGAAGPCSRAPGLSITPANGPASSPKGRSNGSTPSPIRRPGRRSSAWRSTD